MNRFALILFYFLAIHPEGYTQLPSFYSYPPTATIQSKSLSELSGIIPASIKGSYWGHNDGGHETILYRFNDQGEIVQEVQLVGLKNIDWEAMTSDDPSYIYLADVGDNQQIREIYTIYQFAEPTPDVDEIHAIEAWDFEYEDRQSHDCEAIFYMQNRLYLITKTFPPQKPMIFALENCQSAILNQARFVDFLDVDLPFNYAQLITDASYSSHHRQLALLSYFGIVLYSVEAESNLSQPFAAYHSALYGQSEALCFDENNLVVTNERGAIWKYPISFYFPNTTVRDWRHY